MKFIFLVQRFFAISIAGFFLFPVTAAQAGPPTEVAFTGTASAPISAAVAVPAGRALFYTSGTVPPVLNEKVPPGSPERFGDTKAQGIGALRQIETRLKEAGLSLADVIYLRVYITADKTKEEKFDYQGWFDAYAQFFGTKENPVKPARSTVGVASLVNADWLIEIEAVAVYPPSPHSAHPSPTP